MRNKYLDAWGFGFGAGGRRCAMPCEPTDVSRAGPPSPSLVGRWGAAAAVWGNGMRHAVGILDNDNTKGFCVVLIQY